MEFIVENVQNMTVQNNEVNLFELFFDVWKHKRFIVSITILCVILGFVKIKLTAPIYEAKAIIAPPTSTAVERVNYGRSMPKYQLLLPFTRAEIYSIFNENLWSEATRQYFVNDIILPSLTKNAPNISKTENYVKFKELLTIKTLEKGSALSRQEISIKSTSPQKAAVQIKQLLEFVNQQSMTEMTRIIKLQMDSVINELENRIETSKFYDNEQWQSMKSSLAEWNRNNIDDSGKQKMLLTTNKLIYPPEDSELRLMLGSYKLYKNIRLGNINLLYHLDGEIMAPSKPIAPQKRNILFISMIIGLTIGVGWVFIINIFRKSAKIYNS